MITVIKLHHSECVFGCKMVNEFATKCETLLSILEYRPSCNRGWASKQTYYLLKKAISLKISGTVPKGLSQDSDYRYIQSADRQGRWRCRRTHIHWPHLLLKTYPQGGALCKRYTTGCRYGFVCWFVCLFFRYRC